MKCKIDSLGRVVIPIRYRRDLGLKANSELNIEYESGKVIISPTSNTCRLCGKETEPKTAIPLCQSCVERIKKL